MGYVAKEKTYRLRFADSEYGNPEEGDPLEVVVRSATIGELVEITQLAEAADNKSISEQVAAFDTILRAFADHLVSWNIERAGVPVPATLEGLRSLEDVKLASVLIEQWQKAIGGVAPPLPQTPLGGERFLAASMNMETLSASQLTSLGLA